MQEAAAVLWNGKRSFQGAESIGVEAIGSMDVEVAWVPYPGDLRKRYPKTRSDMQMAQLSCNRKAQSYSKEEEGEIMEMKYDVGFFSKPTYFLANWPVGNTSDERKP